MHFCYKIACHITMSIKYHYAVQVNKLSIKMM